MPPAGTGRGPSTRLWCETFIASFDTPPEDLTLDFDATDDAVHGRQEGRFFHGYYDHYCFLPLYGSASMSGCWCYLRPSRIDAQACWAILGLLVKKLRRPGPRWRMVLRGDSGFCRHKMARLVRQPRQRPYRRPCAKNKRLNRFRRAAAGRDRGPFGQPSGDPAAACSARSPMPPGPGSGHCRRDRPYRALSQWAPDPRSSRPSILRPRT